MSKAVFHTLKIASVRQQTSDAIAIGFQIPRELKEDFAFLPGQYFTLRATIDGEDIRRSYSICSSNNDEVPEVGIKHVAGGKFSSFAQNLQVGDTLEVLPPQGTFTAKTGGKHSYLLLAAGSGITPCLSIAKSVLHAEPESEITIIYGNQSVSSIMFLDDLIHLKDKFTTKLQLFHLLSREQTDLEFLNGRLGREKLLELDQLSLLDIPNFDAAFICGPHEMTKELIDTLEELGMEKEKIRTELFLAPGQDSVPKRPNIKNTSVGAKVSIILDGTSNTIVVDGSKSTILAAAQDAGLDLPFSCAGGMCCTCRCKVVSGETQMDVNYSLQDWEINAGFTLACQSRPKSNAVTIDFDAT